MPGYVLIFKDSNGDILSYHHYNKTHNKTANNFQNFTSLIEKFTTLIEKLVPIMNVAKVTSIFPKV